MHTDSDRIDFIAGQAHAMKGVLRALVQTHPNPPSLLIELEALLLGGTANAGASPVSETFLEGFGDVVVRLRNAATERVG